MGIAEEKYVLCTTFRRSGQPVATPVWIAALDDGRFGFTTEGSSGKAKRLRNDPRVTLQACDARGRTLAGSKAMSATAEHRQHIGVVERERAGSVRGRWAELALRRVLCEEPRRGSVVDRPGGLRLWVGVLLS